jgi:hypothetical protein
MQRSLLILASLLVLGSAQANEVFMTKDAQGRMVYTDRPDSLPAQRINVATAKGSETPAAPSASDAKTRADADKAKADAARQAVESKQAKELTATDKARRCIDARMRYEQVVNAQRLYEPGASEEDRRYLDDNEIDAARASARKTMDEFCAGQ